MSERSLPTIRVTRAFTEALCADALAELSAAELTAFLLQRRWFGGKGRAPSDVRVGDVVDLRAGDAHFAIARLDVEMGGRTAFYQLPLAVRRDDGAESAGAVLARVECEGGEHGLLVDAVEDEGFRRALGRAFASGATFGGRARWIVEPVEGGAARPEVGDVPSRTVRAEQSNTSIIFGDAAIMKLFRRMEPGMNPDVEIGRFLTTKTRFTHTPPLLGVIRYEGSGDVHAIAGMLQGFLAGSRDAWQDVLERSRPFFAADARDARHPYVEDAEQLGRVTRELHDALASAREDADFVPRRATPADVARWVASARRRVEEATALLAERLEADGLRDAEQARAVLERRDADFAHLDEIAATIGDDAGRLVRHHGDYHLGQVLRTAGGDFQIIDFEGEPARPLAERRERNSALRDVAGMLRSFAYAAATLAAEQRGKADTHALEQRAAEWERGARAAFLHGYLGGGHAAFLPDEPQRVDALLELFETEKVYYEMSYELNNRPEWVWIPLNGALALRSTPAGRT
ncbi:MAG TPA: putative maltokinase [Gemmatimonadaceae bacterium]